MADREVLFHHLALQEYLNARDWYSKRNLTAANQFQSAIKRVIQQIEQFPAAGSPFGPQYRWMRTRRFPYVIYYEMVTEQRIVIMAVAHRSRRQGYWLRRSSSS
jgi:plasmid stabilization system protein ParE